MAPVVAHDVKARAREPELAHKLCEGLGWVETDGLDWVETDAAACLASRWAACCPS